MTIRQQGGIFGRNPTFNNVTVDGTLTVDQIAEKTGAAGIMLDGVTLKDGNVVLAGGKGIDFSATSGTGTSELFDDYEEGTWTPGIQQGGFSSITVLSATYTKIGRVVCARASITFVGVGIAEDLYLNGLPFNVTVNGWTPGAAYFQTYTGASPWVVALARSNTAFVSFAEIGDDVWGNEVSGYCGFQVTYETT